VTGNAKSIKRGDAHVDSCSPRERFSGVAGLLFVALSFLAAGVNVLPPAHDDGRQAFVEWLARDGQPFRVWHFVAGLAFLLFYFPFFAGLCEKLRQAEGTPAIFTSVVWAGAIMSPAAGTTSGAFVVGASLLGDAATPEILMFAAAAQHCALVVSGAYGGVALIGAAVIILQPNPTTARTPAYGRRDSRILHRWHSRDRRE
jgi:hypothetical protein